MQLHLFIEHRRGGRYDWDLVATFTPNTVTAEQVDAIRLLPSEEDIPPAVSQHLLRRWCSQQASHYGVVHTGWLGASALRRGLDLPSALRLAGGAILAAEAGDDARMVWWFVPNWSDR